MPLGAVAEWLAADTTEPVERVAADLAARSSAPKPHGYVEDVLSRGSHRWRGRAYSKTKDGPAVARLVPPEDVPDEIASFLAEVFAPVPGLGLGDDG